MRTPLGNAASADAALAAAATRPSTGRQAVVSLAGLVAAIAVLALTFGGARPANAAFPGGNGKIAFASYRDGNYELYVMNADGSGQTRLTQTDEWESDPAWSPDGSKLAFTRLSPTGNDDVYVMNADGSGETNLTDRTNADRDPAWSPDGTKIAYTSARDGDYEVWVMNADGSGKTNLTRHPGPDVDPVWSPDGSKIAYTSFPNGRNDVYVMNADGSEQTNLTQNPNGEETQPAWSPDGSKIAFTSFRDGGTEIHNQVYVMNTDGSGQTNLSRNSAIDQAPAWSPDGSKITFTSFRDGKAEVYVMNADGSGQTNLTQNADHDADSAWQTVPSADLALSLAAAPDVAKAQKPLTYTITVANAGPSNAAGVIVTDVLSPEMRFVSASPSQGTCVTPPAGATGTVECNLGFLLRGGSAAAEVAITVVARKTSVTNTATVSSATPDPNPANNSATIATPVR